MHAQLPPALRGLLPAPDTAFIDGAVSPVLGSWQEHGLRDLEELSTAVQVVFVTLGAAADQLLSMSVSDPERLEKMLRTCG